MRRAARMIQPHPRIPCPDSPPHGLRDELRIALPGRQLDHMCKQLRVRALIHPTGAWLRHRSSLQIVSDDVRAQRRRGAARQSTRKLQQIANRDPATRVIPPGADEISDRLVRPADLARRDRRSCGERRQYSREPLRVTDGVISSALPIPLKDDIAVSTHYEGAALMRPRIVRSLLQAVDIQRLGRWRLTWRGWLIAARNKLTRLVDRSRLAGGQRDEIVLPEEWMTRKNQHSQNQ